jgi:hypothetical protein
MLEYIQIRSIEFSVIAGFRIIRQHHGTRGAGVLVAARCGLLRLSGPAAQRALSRARSLARRPASAARRRQYALPARCGSTPAAVQRVRLGHRGSRGPQVPARCGSRGFLSLHALSVVAGPPCCVSHPHDLQPPPLRRLRHAGIESSGRHGRRRRQARPTAAAAAEDVRRVRPPSARDVHSVHALSASRALPLHAGGKL